MLKVVLIMRVRLVIMKYNKQYSHVLANKLDVVDKTHNHFMPRVSTIFRK